MEDLVEHVDAIDQLYSSNTDTAILTNFNDDLKVKTLDKSVLWLNKSQFRIFKIKLDDASSSGHEENPIESEIKLAPKEFDEDEYHSEEETSTKKETVEVNEEEEALPVERNDEWRSQPKHVFILSEAGKPIYSL